MAKKAKKLEDAYIDHKAGDAWYRSCLSQVEETGNPFVLCTLTSDLCAYILMMRNKRNRPITDDGVQRFIKIVENGEFITCSQVISFSTAGSLNNGQHRVKGIFEAMIDVEIWIMFNEDPRAIEVIDNGRRRTAAEADKLNKGEGSRAVTSLAKNFLVCTGPNPRVIRQAHVETRDILKVMEKYPLMRECVYNASKFKRDHKGNSLSEIGLRTFEFMVRMHPELEEDSQVFWEKLIDGLNIKPKKDAAIARLMKAINAGKLFIPQSSSHAYTTAVLIQIFNAWRSGSSVRDVSLVWESGRPFPKVLPG